MVPSTPMFQMPARCTTSSPIAENSIGVAVRIIAAAMLIRIALSNSSLMDRYLDQPILRRDPGTQEEDKDDALDRENQCRGHPDQHFHVKRAAGEAAEEQGG